MYIKQFENFDSAVLNLEDVFSLNEQKCMAKYGLDEFKKFFGTEISESLGSEDESLMEQAHTYYEMSMLSEAKSHWFDSEGEIYKIDADTHIILVKENEAYIIEKKTHDAINEWWSWQDAAGAWNKFSSAVSSYVSNKWESGKKWLSSTWASISDGAQKAWEWTKKAAAAVVKFLSEMTWIEWASLGIGILSAVVGLLGAVIPGATIIGGVLMALNGGIHLYEGWHKYHEAIEAFGSIKDLSRMEKTAAAVGKGLPDAVFGSIFLCLGFYDLSHGISEALVNPAAGSISMGIKTAAVAGAHSWVGKMAHNLEKVLGGFLKEFLEKMGYKIAGTAAANLTSLIASAFGTAALSSILGWVWKGLLSGIKLLVQGIEFLLSLPKKITEGIEMLEKNATGTIGTIVTKGLSALVKPMASSCAKVIEKYIQPFINKAKSWLDFQIKSYDKCVAILDKHKSEMQPQGLEVPKTKGKSVLPQGQGVKGKKSDLKKIKKLPKINKELKQAAAGKGYEVKTKNKLKESFEFEIMKHLASFDGFKPI